ncbi:hypothetical protein [Vibrio atlanticus]|uniref:hypothetical protein n=1 Tax=Vibrio atlanticus TaxID=693153 RepID=UPI00354DB7E8
MFATTRGSASEALTSIQGVFSVFDDAGALREPAELLLDILDAAGDSSSKLKDVFTDAVSVQGLKSLFDSENKQKVIEMVKATDDLGATQKASAINAATFNSSMTALNNSFNKYANQRLAEPIGDLADAINSIDDDTIQNWLKWGETAIWALGSVVALSKGVKLVNAGRRFLGDSKKSGSGKGGFQDLGAMPVFVVNMPGGGMAGAGGGSSTSKPSKGRSGVKAGAVVAAGTVAKMAVPAYVAYEASSFGASVIDTALDSIFDGYRDADRKFTTKIKAYLGNKEAQQQAVQYYEVDPKSYERSPSEPSSYLTGNYAQPSSQSNYPIGGQVNVKVDLSGDRPKVTATSSSPTIQIDPDTGAN